MAWQASFQSVEDRAGQFLVALTYSDGQQRIRREHLVESVDDARVKTLARDDVATLDATAAQKAALTFQPGAAVDLTPPPPPADPDPARTAFLRNWRTLLGFQHAVDLGVIPATNPGYVASKAATAAAWLDRFAGLI